jgi:hypothetical protein
VSYLLALLSPDVLLSLAFFAGLGLVTIGSLFEAPSNRFSHVESVFRRFRRSLLQRMLSWRGISSPRFQHRYAPEQLDQMLGTCQLCPQRSYCKDCLAQSCVSSFAFCPNDKFIRQLGS